MPIIWTGVSHREGFFYIQFPTAKRYGYYFPFYLLQEAICITYIAEMFAYQLSGSSTDHVEIELNAMIAGLKSLVGTKRI